MKKLSIALLFLGLFITGCKQPTSPSSKKDSKSKDLVKLEVTSGMEKINILYSYNGVSENQINSVDFYLYENPEDESYVKWERNPKSTYFTFDKLTPGHEYTLKIEVSYDSFSKTFTDEKKISTLPKAAPTIKGSFDTSASETNVQISWKEIGSFTKRIELYRSDSENGEYTKVNTKDYPSNNSYIYDTTMQSKKTYWYKVISYEKDSSEQYVKIGESNAVQVTTGAFVPTTIPAENINCKKGITSLVFEWPEVDGAEKYTVILKDNAIFDKVTLEQKDVTENTYIFRGLQPDTKYNFYLTVTTNGGTSGAQSLESRTAKASFPLKNSYGLNTEYDKCVPKIEADQTKATYSFNVPFEDTTDCTVYFTLRRNTDADSELLCDIGEIENYFFIRENLTPATSYSNYVYNEPTSGYLHMTVTYKDAGGNDTTTDSYIGTNSFYTSNLNPPTNLRITDITKTTATISFDELSEEEKIGKTPKYTIKAYDKDGNLAKGTNGYYIEKEGDSSPITLNNLIKGSEYIFKAETSFEGATSSAPHKETQIIGFTASGIEQKPVVTLKEIQPDDSESALRGIFTYINAEWDALDEAEGVVPENLVYGLEYKIFEHSKYRRVQKSKQDVTYTGTESFSEKFLVNGGNKYTVRVYAYDSTEPGDIVYSDTVKIQLTKIDDSQMFGALTYSQWFAEYADEEDIYEGGIVDFANKKVWVNEKTLEPAEIRSTSKAYNVGYLQLFGKVEQTKFLFPSYDGYKFISFKFNFEKAIENPKDEKVTCVPRILLFDRDCFNFQLSDYGYIEGVYYVIPNEHGTIIEGHTDDEEPYLFEQYKMPYFQGGKTTTHPSEAGLEIDESWVFNNSIYMGVSQTQAGNIGFSYYY